MSSLAVSSTSSADVKSIHYDPVELFRQMSGSGRSGGNKKSTALGVKPLSAFIQKKSPLELYHEAVSSSNSELVTGTRPLSEKDYPALAALKLAGRAIEKIAEIFGTTEAVVQPHVQKALAKLRAGEIEVNDDYVREESIKEAKSDNREFVSDMINALETPEAVTKALEAMSASTAVTSAHSEAALAEAISISMLV